MRREAFKFWDLVRLILETLWCVLPPYKTRFLCSCTGTETGQHIRDTQWFLEHLRTHFANQSQGTCELPPLLIQIGSDNGLMHPGYKRLPEPILTQFYVGTCRHYATMCKFVGVRQLFSNILVKRPKMFTEKRTKYSYVLRAVKLWHMIWVNKFSISKRLF